MSKFEKCIEILEDCAVSAKTSEEEEAYESANDAMAFVQALHSLYVDQGVLPTEAEPDLAVLENLVDAYHGELAAAAIFLAESAFGRVPEVLRATAASLEKDDGGVVPLTVCKGFERFASRIERVREQQQQVLQALDAAKAE